MPIPQVTDRLKEAPAVALRAVFAGIGQLLMAVDKIRAQMQEHATSAAPGQQRPSAAPPPRGQADGASNVTALPERATSATKPGTGPGAAKAGAATKPTAGTKQGAAAKPAAGTKQGASAVKSTQAKPTAAAKPAAGTKPGATAKPAAGTEPVAAAAKPAAETKPSDPGKPADTSAAPTREPAAAKPAPPAATTVPAATAVPAAPIPGYDDLSVASLRARLRGLDAAGVRALLDYEKANARRDDVITMFERRLSKIENGTS